MRTLPGVLALALVLARGAGAAAASVSPESAAEIAALEAVARDPGHAPSISFGGAGPRAESRAAYDAAYAAVRKTLRASPLDASVRARYAELLLWRGSFYPEESGGLKRAIEQVLIGLRDEPAGTAGAEFLGRPDVLDRLLSEESAESAAEAEDGLKRALDKEPGNAAAARALVRLQIMSGKKSDSIDSARAFAARAADLPEALALQGAAELSADDASSARDSFQTALDRASAPRVESAAALGLADALRRLGRLDEAETALARARAKLDPAQVRRAALDAALPAPELISWNLGKALAAAGFADRAAALLGPSGMEWASTTAAQAKNQEGVRLFEAGDTAGAQAAFREAAELLPAEPLFWRNAARAAFERKRYSDAIWDFRKTGELETLSNMDSWKLSVSYATLGDYESAYETVEAARAKAPGEQWLAQWAVVLAYGAHGWDRAFAQWGETVDHDRSDNDIRQKKAALDLVLGGIGYFAERAEGVDARYASLLHESLLFRAEEVPIVSYDLGVAKYQAPILVKIAELYRKLPLKPAVPPEAAEAASLAGDEAAAGHFQAAAKLYARAISAAPWWPQAHLGLAVAACVMDDVVARREMDAYFQLVPRESPEAAAARDIVAHWNPIGPGKDE